jgi:hypothetical protein
MSFWIEKLESLVATSEKKITGGLQLLMPSAFKMNVLIHT